MASKVPGLSPGGSGVFSSLFRQLTFPTDPLNRCCILISCSSAADNGCSVPRVPNGTPYVPARIPYSSVIYFHCHQGYVLVGAPSQQTCLGGVSISPPVCVGMTPVCIPHTLIDYGNAGYSDCRNIVCLCIVVPSLFCIPHTLIDYSNVGYSDCRSIVCLRIVSPSLICILHTPIDYSNAGYSDCRSIVSLHIVSPSRLYYNMHAWRALFVIV